jgi:predicted flap endonuclease-1-like 5' DNA nuclease
VKRCARVGGVVVGVAATAAGLFWLLKDRMSGPPRIPLDEPSPFPAPSPAPGEPPHVPDDLSEVKGIGPVYRARLTEAGMATFAALATADPATVAGHAGVTERMAADWIAQASALARR